MRLADARPALDDEKPTSALKQRLDRCQLPLALDQLPHERIYYNGAASCRIAKSFSNSAGAGLRQPPSL